MDFETFKKLNDTYGTDTISLLRDNPSLENLRAFGKVREELFEWVELDSGKSLLQIGADEGAYTGPFIKKGLKLTVLESDEEEAKKIACRYPEVEIVSELNADAGFDYVVAAGENIQTLQNLLTDNRTLAKEAVLIACDNKFGIKSWTGVVSTSRISKDAIKTLLGENTEFYYPVWDYEFPTAIYSDKFLPAKGEIRHIAAFGEPEIKQVSVEEKLDEVCEEGRFADYANSFIAIARMSDTAATGEDADNGNAADNGKSADTESADSRRPVFVKYNPNRREEYQLKTTIYEYSDGHREVEKTALCEKGFAHIASFIKKRAILNSEGRDIEYIEGRLSDDGSTITFPYIKGEVVTDIDFMFDGRPIHNIDAIPSNFIKKDGRIYGIDYEWVSDEPQDPEYVRWRGAYTSAGYICSDADDTKFRKLEDAFQAKVTGDIQQINLDNYRVKEFVLDEKTRKDVILAKDRIDGLEAQLKAKYKELSKLTEVKRLTDNHVSNLEVMMGDKDAEITRMRESIDYLSRHESLMFRARRKLADKVNEKYPKGSRERKELMYKLRPLSTAKLKATAEGRNLIDGDFAIGDLYKLHGRLRFTHYDEPEVSIIIPCYNQVEYTYRCLLSVLANTPLSYEVILADDQSTDATARITDFVEGITVARTEANSGFLRNCNNAAKSARGKYIMFLNNDTEVCEGWLTSLVATLERDSTIGMTGSKLVFPDGKLQEAGGIIWSDGSGWNYGRGDSPDRFEYNYLRDVDYISGAAILIRHELWNEIGGFDDRFAPAYCEDSDLAFEVRKHGYRVVYQPLSKVIHYEGISNGTDVNGSGLKRYQIENSEKLKAKWADEFADQFENTGNPDPFRARERSRDKKIILVIDHYVPTFDKDAGSRTSFAYIKLFLAKGYEVKFLGANFLHEEPYTTILQQLGVELIYGLEMKSGIWNWLDKHMKEFELVYINRPHIAADYIDYFKTNNVKVIFYGHDLHFLRMERAAELAENREEALEESRYWKSVEMGIISKADMSYYPSQTEVDAIRAIDERAKVKAITAYVYDDFKDAEYDYARREGLLFVGGFAHPPNKDGLKAFIETAWDDVYAKLKQPLYVVGSKADEEVKELCNRAGIVFKGFVSDEELTELYSKCRMVVVPLRYGAGVKGKVIEALYNGCPVITTSVGAEGIPDAEEVMIIEDDMRKWAGVMSAKDADFCNALSSRALEYVKEHHSIDAAWNRIRKDFE